MKNSLAFFFILIFFSQSVLAQYFDTGQDPASLKWKQIKTSRFTVIFPESYTEGGIQYAKSLEDAYSNLLSLFPEKKFRLPVIIHNYTLQSNGYVVWAPKRMELYPTPEQNTVPLAPEKQLTFHEMAHVFQIESLNQGFSKWMSVLFGEQFAGVTSALLPMWTLEGDAVFTESFMTASGRGRTPAFQKQLKALVLEKKNFGYDKILNGSYRDFVPDYYATGFQMVTLAMAKNDLQLWNRVFKFTGEEPFTLNPVNISLSHNYGLRKKLLWNETYDTLRSMWTRDISINHSVSYNQLNPDRKGHYINYYSPVVAGRDSIIAIKTSLTDPPYFMLIDPDQRKEKRLHIPGEMYPYFISFGGGKLVWVEYQRDPRWENREYSVIKMLDIKHNTTFRLSSKTRYLAASVSPDGSRIAAIENSIDNINSLVLLDASNGKIVKKAAVPENAYLQHPQWDAAGSAVTFITLTDDGEGIISYKFKSGNWVTELNPERNDLQSSIQRNDSLFFISSLSGTDNIYLRTPDNKTFQLTSSKYGVSDISLGNNTILFSDYGSSGNNISSIKASQAPYKILNTSYSPLLIDRIKIASKPDTTGVNKNYIPERYLKWQHIFRFHSWMPFYADVEELKVDPSSIRPGITLLTQNSLSTLTSTLGYEYSRERRNVIHTRVTWKGWYPEFESQLDYGYIPLISKPGASVANPSSIKPGLTFLNTVSIPLTFSEGKFSQFVRPSFSMQYLNRYIYLEEPETYDYGQTIFTARLFLSNYHQSALRDIFPRWAQVADFNYCFAPFDRELYGSVISLKTVFYFPGIFRNQGLRIKAETEKQKTEKYLYGNFSSIPRGYRNIVAKEISFLSADYAMPLLYPDFNVASLIYIKRIRTSLFYDYAEGPGNSIYRYTSTGLIPFYNNARIESLKSFGIELLADFNALRIPYTISAGIQMAWKQLNGSPYVGLLFNIDLFGMTVGKNRTPRATPFR